jgi:hypothetical protein
MSERWRGERCEAARYLRRIAEKLAEALDEDADDVLARDAAIREALPLWGLAFKHCQGLKEPVQDLLSHLLTCLSSPLAAQKDAALKQLHAVVSELAQYVGGTTEKDVDALVIRLEEAGFDLTAPISALPVAEGDEATRAAVVQARTAAGAAAGQTPAARTKEARK